MINYFYTAKSAEGETKTGTLSAKNLHQLAQELKKGGLVLIKAVPEEEQERKKIRFSFPFSRVSSKDKIILTRNLEIMVATGLPLVKSFSILANQAKNRKLKKALLEIKEEINKGGDFSSALSRQPDIFSEFYQNMVKIGEESGTLEDVLKTLTTQLKKEHQLKSKIRGAMIYPAIILTVMIAVGIVVMTIILPQLSGLFKELGTEIPFSTRALLVLGDFFSKYWYFLILFFLFLLLFLWKILKTKKGKKIIDTILIKMPIFSSLVKKSNSAFLIRSLSSLIAAGVPIVKSLKITAGTVNNFYFKEALNEVAEKVKEGEKLFASLQPYQYLFPTGTIEIIEVGEETGKTSTILKELAEFYEEEVINIVENLSTIIEPVLLLILGVAIAFFAVSIMQPIYSLGGL